MSFQFSLYIVMRRIWGEWMKLRKSCVFKLKEPSAMTSLVYWFCCCLEFGKQTLFSYIGFSVLFRVLVFI